MPTMTSEDQYAQIAPFYDLEFDSFDADVDLYLGYAQIVGGPVLELGCGSGRLLLPIAEAGFQVTGVDNSASMLDRARQRLNGVPEAGNVQLESGDMRDLNQFGRNSFNLIIVAINSFLHLESREDQLTALSEMRRVPGRDGLLVLDLFNPTPDTLVRMEDRYTFDSRWTVPSGDRVERYSYRQLDSANQFVTTTLFYDVISASGTVTRHTTSYQMRYIHRFELESLLEGSGFEIEGLYGSYALDPLEHDSEHLIAVAHRTPDPGEP